MLVYTFSLTAKNNPLTGMLGHMDARSTRLRAPGRKARPRAWRRRRRHPRGRAPRPLPPNRSLPTGSQPQLQPWWKGPAGRWDPETRRPDAYMASIRSFRAPRSASGERHRNERDGEDGRDGRDGRRERGQRQRSEKRGNKVFAFQSLSADRIGSSSFLSYRLCMLKIPR